MLCLPSSWSLLVRHQARLLCRHMACPSNFSNMWSLTPPDSPPFRPAPCRPGDYVNIPPFGPECVGSGQLVDVAGASTVPADYNYNGLQGGSTPEQPMEPTEPVASPSTAPVLPEDTAAPAPEPGMGPEEAPVDDLAAAPSPAPAEPMPVPVPSPVPSPVPTPPSAASLSAAASSLLAAALAVLAAALLG